MTNEFPKDITDCMRDCLLAILWPRKDIIAFFENNGCTQHDLGPIRKYEEQKLGRAQIVELVFASLQHRDDAGLGQFRSMLQSLVNWDHFDPYYFDKLIKLNKDKAQQADRSPATTSRDTR